MSLFNELKRRNVFRVGIAYLVSAWVIAQVASLVLDSIKAPDWVMQTLLMLLGFGFIISLIISWAYEITPEGIKKEQDITHNDSVANLTTKKLNIVIIGLLVVAIALFFLDRFGEPQAAVETSQEMTQKNSDEQVKKEIVSATESSNDLSNKSIAVLPFTNMANTSENEPFTVGLHDDLLTHLSKISALKVISRTSVMEYKDTTKKIKQIASELGVSNILEGGVQRSGNQIRLNVQLIDANTDEHLWAEIYDRELTTANIFKIQSEISREIAKALKAQLTPAESESITKIPTDNLAAYDAYIAARLLTAQRQSDSLRQALALFQKASELDPNFALAYSGQARTIHLLNYYSDLSQAEMFTQGEPLIAKALEIDPLLAEAHAVKGSYLNSMDKYVEAEESFKLSLGLDPNRVDTYLVYSWMLRSQLGRYPEALALIRKAAVLDPLSNVVLNNLGWNLRYLGNPQEALQLFNQVHRLNPSFPPPLEGLAWVNDDLGNFKLAIINQTKAINLDPGNIRYRAWLFYHYLNIGDVPAAQSVLAEAKHISPVHFRYVRMESLLKMLEGDYKSARQKYVTLLEKQPERIDLNLGVARYSFLNSDCETSIASSRVVSPEMFADGYVAKVDDVYEEIALAWCFKQMGQPKKFEELLTKTQHLLENIDYGQANNYFAKAAIYAVRGQTKKAAKAYAKIVESKRTSRWYLLDHYPYFIDVKKEPLFISARQQLMQDLAEQRRMLAEYRASSKTK